jgi:dipeptidase E
MHEVLLLSNSTAPGQGFLQHALGVIGDVLQDRRRLLFVAFASSDPDKYTQLMRENLAPIGVRVDAAHLAADPRRAVLEAEAVFVGGGNSFRLLSRFSALGLLDELHARILDGVPYLGASAGASLACPTIRTTNDMPIVEPGSFRALGLIPFQINAHYPIAVADGAQAEQARQREICGFLEENDVPVLGMPEGTCLRLSGDGATIGGVSPCQLLRRDCQPHDLPPGSDVSWLLHLPARFDSAEAPRS